MPRPKNKEELLSLSQENFEKLIDFVIKLPKEKLENFPSGTLNRNVRDVFAHLYHWHLMFTNWKEEGEKGHKPAIPAEGYSWKTTPELNRKINELYEHTSLDESQKLLDASHKSLMNLISSLTNEQLFTKKHYKWTGTTSLGAYLISATSSHYDWALKLIKKATK